ncbi:hypothetical protein Bpfe_015553 [Biomphalaria pfeifferi]|uniref:Uncharacterized protein n=1 Tax=Biomphalaria pfeifferi TaxID=112525 RepID=A0AAD8F7X7_BIOPF|nr:hypothetical protein Bpfe_015553 [Biomphalaria pfeifferi]
MAMSILSVRNETSQQNSQHFDQKCWSIGKCHLKVKQTKPGYPVFVRSETSVLSTKGYVSDVGYLSSSDTVLSDIARERCSAVVKSVVKRAICRDPRDDPKCGPVLRKLAKAELLRRIEGSQHSSSFPQKQAASQRFPCNVTAEHRLYRDTKSIRIINKRSVSSSKLKDKSEYRFSSDRYVQKQSRNSESVNGPCQTSFLVLEPEIRKCRQKYSDSKTERRYSGYKDIKEMKATAAHKSRSPGKRRNLKIIIPCRSHSAISIIISNENKNESHHGDQPAKSAADSQQRRGSPRRSPQNDKPLEVKGNEPAKGGQAAGGPRHPAPLTDQCKEERSAPKPKSQARNSKQAVWQRDNKPASSMIAKKAVLKCIAENPTVEESSQQNPNKSPEGNKPAQKNKGSMKPIDAPARFKHISSTSPTEVQGLNSSDTNKKTHTHSPNFDAKTSNKQRHTDSRLADERNHDIFKGSIKMTFHARSHSLANDSERINQDKNSLPLQPCQGAKNKHSSFGEEGKTREHNSLLNQKHYASPINRGKSVKMNQEKDQDVSDIKTGRSKILPGPTAHLAKGNVTSPNNPNAGVVDVRLLTGFMVAAYTDPWSEAHKRDTTTLPIAAEQDATEGVSDDQSLPKKIKHGKEGMGKVKAANKTTGQDQTCYNKDGQCLQQAAAADVKSILPSLCMHHSSVTSSDAGEGPMVGEKLLADDILKPAQMECESSNMLPMEYRPTTPNKMAQPVLQNPIEDNSSKPETQENLAINTKNILSKSKRSPEKGIDNALTDDTDAATISDISGSVNDKLKSELNDIVQSVLQFLQEEKKDPDSCAPVFSKLPPSEMEYRALGAKSTISQDLQRSTPSPVSSEVSETTKDRSYSLVKAHHSAPSTHGSHSLKTQHTTLNKPSEEIINTQTTLHSPEKLKHPIEIQMSDVQRCLRPRSKAHNSRQNELQEISDKALDVQRGLTARSGARASLLNELKEGSGKVLDLQRGLRPRSRARSSLQNELKESSGKVLDVQKCLTPRLAARASLQNELQESSDKALDVQRCRTPRSSACASMQNELKESSDKVLTKHAPVSQTKKTHITGNGISTLEILPAKISKNSLNQRDSPMPRYHERNATENSAKRPSNSTTEESSDSSSGLNKIVNTQSNKKPIALDIATNDTLMPQCSDINKNDDILQDKEQKTHFVLPYNRLNERKARISSQGNEIYMTGSDTSIVQSKRMLPASSVHRLLPERFLLDTSHNELDINREKEKISCRCAAIHSILTDLKHHILLDRISQFKYGSSATYSSPANLAADVRPPFELYASSRSPLSTSETMNSKPDHLLSPYKTPEKTHESCSRTENDGSSVADSVNLIASIIKKNGIDPRDVLRALGFKDDQIKIANDDDDTKKVKGDQRSFIESYCRQLIQEWRQRDVKGSTRESGNENMLLANDSFNQKSPMVAQLPSPPKYKSKKSKKEEPKSLSTDHKPESKATNKEKFSKLDLSRSKKRPITDGTSYDVEERVNQADDDIGECEDLNDVRLNSLLTKFRGMTTRDLLEFAMSHRNKDIINKLIVREVYERATRKQEDHAGNPQLREGALQLFSLLSGRFINSKSESLKSILCPAEKSKSTSLAMQSSKNESSFNETIKTWIDVSKGSSPDQYSIMKAEFKERVKENQRIINQWSFSSFREMKAEQNFPRPESSKFRLSTLNTLWAKELSPKRNDSTETENSATSGEKMSESKKNCTKKPVQLSSSPPMFNLLKESKPSGRESFKPFVATDNALRELNSGPAVKFTYPIVKKSGTKNVNTEGVAVSYLRASAADRSREVKIRDPRLDRQSLKGDSSPNVNFRRDSLDHSSPSERSTDSSERGFSSHRNQSFLKYGVDHTTYYSESCEIHSLKRISRPKIWDESKASLVKKLKTKENVCRTTPNANVLYSNSNTLVTCLQSPVKTNPLPTIPEKLDAQTLTSPNANSIWRVPKKDCEPGQDKTKTNVGAYGNTDIFDSLKTDKSAAQKSVSTIANDPNKKDQILKQSSVRSNGKGSVANKPKKDEEERLQRDKHTQLHADMIPTMKISKEIQKKKMLYENKEPKRLTCDKENRTRIPHSVNKESILNIPVAELLEKKRPRLSPPMKDKEVSTQGEMMTKDNEAHLQQTGLFEAHLQQTGLFEAHLQQTGLFEAHLQQTGLFEAHLLQTGLFAKVEMSLKKEKSEEPLISISNGELQHNTQGVVLKDSDTLQEHEDYHHSPTLVDHCSGQSSLASDKIDETVPADDTKNVTPVETDKDHTEDKDTRQLDKMSGENDASQTNPDYVIKDTADIIDSDSLPRSEDKVSYKSNLPLNNDLPVIIEEQHSQVSAADNHELPAVVGVSTTSNPTKCSKFDLSFDNLDSVSEHSQSDQENALSVNKPVIPESNPTIDTIQKDNREKVMEHSEKGVTRLNEIISVNMKTHSVSFIAKNVQEICVHKQPCVDELVFVNASDGKRKEPANEQAKDTSIKECSELERGANKPSLGEDARLEPYFLDDNNIHTMYNERFVNVGIRDPFVLENRGEIEDALALEKKDKIEDASELEKKDKIEGAFALENKDKNEDASELEKKDKIEDAFTLENKDKIEDASELEKKDKIEDASELQKKDKIGDAFELENTEKIKDAFELEKKDQILNAFARENTIKVDFVLENKDQIEDAFALENQYKIEDAFEMENKDGIRDAFALENQYDIENAIGLENKGRIRDAFALENKEIPKIIVEYTDEFLRKTLSPTGMDSGQIRPLSLAERKEILDQLPPQLDSKEADNLLTVNMRYNIQKAKSSEHCSSYCEFISEEDPSRPFGRRSPTVKKRSCSVPLNRHPFAKHQSLEDSDEQNGRGLQGRKGSASMPVTCSSYEDSYYLLSPHKPSFPSSQNATLKTARWENPIQVPHYPDKGTEMENIMSTSENSAFNQTKSFETRAISSCPINFKPFHNTETLIAIEEIPGDEPVNQATCSKWVGGTIITQKPDESKVPLCSVFHEPRQSMHTNLQCPFTHSDHYIDQCNQTLSYSQFSRRSYLQTPEQASVVTNTSTSLVGNTISTAPSPLMSQGDVFAQTDLAKAVDQPLIGSHRDIGAEANTYQACGEDTASEVSSSVGSTSATQSSEWLLSDGFKRSYKGALLPTPNLSDKAKCVHYVNPIVHKSSVDQTRNFAQQVDIFNASGQQVQRVQPINVHSYRIVDSKSQRSEHCRMHAVDPVSTQINQTRAVVANSNIAEAFRFPSHENMDHTNAIYDAGLKNSRVSEVDYACLPMSHFNGPYSLSEHRSLGQVYYTADQHSNLSSPVNSGHFCKGEANVANVNHYNHQVNMFNPNFIRNTVTDGRGAILADDRWAINVLGKRNVKLSPGEMKQGNHIITHQLATSSHNEAERIAPKIPINCLEDYSVHDGRTNQFYPDSRPTVKHVATQSANFHLSDQTRSESVQYNVGNQINATNAYVKQVNSAEMKTIQTCRENSSVESNSTCVIHIGSSDKIEEIPNQDVYTGLFPLPTDSVNKGEEPRLSVCEPKDSDQLSLNETLQTNTDYLHANQSRINDPWNEHCFKISSSDTKVQLQFNQVENADTHSHQTSESKCIEGLCRLVKPTTLVTLASQDMQREIFDPAMSLDNARIVKSAESIAKSQTNDIKCHDPKMVKKGNDISTECSQIKNVDPLILNDSPVKDATLDQHNQSLGLNQQELLKFVKEYFQTNPLSPESNSVSPMCLVILPQNMSATSGPNAVAITSPLEQQSQGFVEEESTSSPSSASSSVNPGTGQPSNSNTLHPLGETDQIKSRCVSPSDKNDHTSASLSVEDNSPSSNKRDSERSFFASKRSSAKILNTNDIKNKSEIALESQIKPNAETRSGSLIHSQEKASLETTVNAAEKIAMYYASTFSTKESDKTHLPDSLDVEALQKHNAIEDDKNITTDVSVNTPPLTQNSESRDISRHTPMSLPWSPSLSSQTTSEASSLDKSQTLPNIDQFKPRSTQQSFITTRVRTPSLSEQVVSPKKCVCDPRDSVQKDDKSAAPESSNKTGCDSNIQDNEPTYYSTSSGKEIEIHAQLVRKAIKEWKQGAPKQCQEKPQGSSIGKINIKDYVNLIERHPSRSAGSQRHAKSPTKLCHVNDVSPSHAQTRKTAISTGRGQVKADIERVRSQEHSPISSSRDSASPNKVSDLVKMFLGNKSPRNVHGECEEDDFKPKPRKDFPLTVTDRSPGIAYLKAIKNQLHCQISSPQREHALSPSRKENEVKVERESPSFNVVSNDASDTRERLARFSKHTLSSSQRKFRSPNETLAKSIRAAKLDSQTISFSESLSIKPKPVSPTPKSLPAFVLSDNVEIFENMYNSDMIALDNDKGLPHELGDNSDSTSIEPQLATKSEIANQNEPSRIVRCLIRKSPLKSKKLVEETQPKHSSSTRRDSKYSIPENDRHVSNPSNTNLPFVLNERECKQRSNTAVSESDDYSKASPEWLKKRGMNGAANKEEGNLYNSCVYLPCANIASVQGVSDSSSDLTIKSTCTLNGEYSSSADEMESAELALENRPGSSSVSESFHSCNSVIQ